ncbi:MAG: class I SAM-dependent methyltransferase [Chloroflexi bacterium]|nr:class I SAM-dependent methyltransferase [Chloroflexota bacterium]
MSDAKRFYDSFAISYDYFVSWPERLKSELPFLLNVLNENGAHRVLDMAGGTGQHAIALMQAGFEVCLADISPEMLQQARYSAESHQLSLPVFQAGFGELQDTFTEPFDALLCLGNSIPHVLDKADLRRTVADMATLVKGGGVMIWQLRNFTQVLAAQERFMDPQSGGTPLDEWLFVRFYDFVPPHIRFNMLQLRRKTNEKWQQHLEQTLLYPWVLGELGPVLAASGWEPAEVFGNLRGEQYEAASSSDLVLVAKRSAA